MNDNKIISLFSYISLNKNKSLTECFSYIANKYNLSRDSVRNMYYQNYNSIKQNKALCEQHNILIENLKKESFNIFTKEEEIKLKQDVESLISKGFSMRKSCLILSNGNKSEAVRYLNKYRLIKKKPNQIIEKCNNEKVTQSKIIKMPILNDVLSETDIQSLFLGLVRLVKNNTIKEMNFAISEKYKEKVSEIYLLKHNLSLVKNELNEEKRKNEKLQTEINLIKNNKLKQYNKLMQTMLANSEIESKKQV